MKVKFVHTNIVAKDWRKLVRFYIAVFGCTPVYPERDISGDWIEKVTDIEGVHIWGLHLRLPGYVDGPTLEVFQYNKRIENDPAVNRSGLAHIAFSVDDVQLFRDKVLENGGGELGDLVKRNVQGLGILTVAYVKDPEGNIIEIQHWE